MPSRANTDVLEPLLSDVRDLIGAHEQGRTGRAGRQWHLAGLNRSIVVMAVSAWEAYVENVVIEAVNALRPQAGPPGSWPALKASISTAKGRFNTPNPQNVKNFVQNGIGMPDITASWSWQRTTPVSARQRLEDVLTQRHQIAHGVHPRPQIRHSHAKSLPLFFKNLAKNTDSSISTYFDEEFDIQLNW